VCVCVCVVCLCVCVYVSVYLSVYCCVGSDNAMLGAYVSNGENGRAIRLYADMRVLDVPVDTHTCSCVLKACAGEKDMSCGREIHGYMIKCGLLCNDIAVNSLVSVYARCDDVEAVKLLFDRRSGKGDAVLWNLMISTYAADSHSTKALMVFKEMLSTTVTPTTYTFVAALQACEELSSVMQIHAVLLKYGLYCDRYVANALVAMYSECGRVDEAERVFNNIDDMDSVSWNSMLAAFVQSGLFDEALDLLRKITRYGRKPDQVSVISVLSACGRARNLLNGMEVHGFAVKSGMDLDIQVGNTITDMYAKCSKTGFMESAFRRIPENDFISWTTVISGYVQNGCHMKALDLLREVLREGHFIDKMMIESVLIACRELKCGRCDSRAEHFFEDH